MSVSQAIASQIPYLRRFARALTASQAGGDAYVLATLEAIVADPNIFAAAGCADGALSFFPEGLGLDAGQWSCRPGRIFLR